MKESNSGPFKSAGSFSWSARRTTNAATTSSLNMYLAGYGSIAESGSRLTYVRKLGRPALVNQMSFGAVRTDGTVNAPPEFAPGSIARFTLFTSPAYRSGPYIVAGSWLLSGEQTAGGLVTFSYLGSPIEIKAEWDFAVTIAVDGVAPGGAQSFMAVMNLESEEH